MRPLGCLVDDGRALVLFDAEVAADVARALDVAAVEMRRNGGLGLPVQLLAVAAAIRRCGHGSDIGGGDTPVLKAAALNVVLGAGSSGAMRISEASARLRVGERQVRRLCRSAGRGWVRVEDVVAAAARRGGA